MKKMPIEIDPLVMRMRNERKARRMPQLKMAGILGVTSNTITFWETGKRTPTRRSKARILAWLEGKNFVNKRPKAMAFANKLRTIRLKRKLTLLAFSKDLGVGVTTVYNWENGISKPSDVNLESLREWEYENPVLEK